MAPGKKPAITAWVGNEGQAAVIGTEVEPVSFIGGLDTEGLVLEGDSVVGFTCSPVVKAPGVVVKVPEFVEGVSASVVLASCTAVSKRTTQVPALGKLVVESGGLDRILWVKGGILQLHIAIDGLNDEEEGQQKESGSPTFPHFWYELGQVSVSRNANIEGLPETRLVNVDLVILAMWTVFRGR
ncbi:hypothetical protein BBP40_002823 [Aspergillus hancockii]|nr:hypothetical protein BBP40_002823 [Aspergillus hancockii]